MKMRTIITLLVLIVLLPMPVSAGGNSVTVCAYVDSDKDGVKDTGEPFRSNVLVSLFRRYGNGTTALTDSALTSGNGCVNLFFKEVGDWRRGRYALSANVFSDYENQSRDNWIYTSYGISGVTVADAGRTFTIALYSVAEIAADGGDASTLAADRGGVK